MADRSRPPSLKRTLALPAALAIGVGTMLGAGVFVFPGLAGERAGPAAMVSFALGGGVALLVAMCTAELATAMPESGGGYHFVSRVYGPLAGVVVGQVLGLVFAGAFYLVAFGRYIVDLLQDLGRGGATLETPVAVTAAVSLIVVNIVGVQSAGRLQRLMILVLTGLLTALFGYGVWQVTGRVGASIPVTPFVPYGVGSVLTTGAMVFTSYLGFVQIVTVAAEVKDPRRTLPRALIGSVIFATTLYVAASYVTTGLLSPERLAQSADNATVEVARDLMGRIGGRLILVAGLLATLSSANASVLSASRALFALSRDGTIPSSFRRVGDRFRTPHVAVVAVGLPIAGLTVVDRLDLLAEAASVLHLVLYAAICGVLVTLRRRPASWFEPSFRVPGGVLIGTLGVLASLGLLTLMQPAAMGVGVAVIGLAGLWYAAYTRRRVDELEP